MKSVFYLPHPVLRPYVRGYWEIESSVSPDLPLHILHGCTGRTHWVTYLNDSEWACTTRRQGAAMANYSSMLMGQMTLPMIHQLVASTHVFIVDFTPTGFQQLWRVPASELSGQMTPVDLVLGNGPNQFADRLREARTFGGRVALMNARLLCQLQRSNPSTDNRMEAAVRLIQEQPGQAQVWKLSKWLNCPERTLSRRFTEAVGVSPNLYTRIHRFLLTRDWLVEHPTGNWNDLIIQAGYYDQAHLINDFRFFSGKAPLIYLADNQLTFDFMRTLAR
ncbi:MAG: AraC family transcriptional regulator [Cytophagales bacterium]|nr:MAG: AraC family transcriptional regulator [Cytophagales bacterium]